MRLTLLIMLLIFSLTACAESGEGAAAQVVEDYLTAKIQGNRDELSRLLCSELESILDREALSFASVSGARIENLACEQNGDVVTCAGQIVATYGTNDQTFPLTSYRVVQEDGEWKWCGEAG
ncbi:MAG: hypothetical protein Kow00117_12060 [Phototrophicales bacterium]